MNNFITSPPNAPDSLHSFNILLPSNINDEPVSSDGIHMHISPNPFNSSTRISLSLPNNQHVTLKVYDLLGREVACLVDEVVTAGTHSLLLNASHLSSGVYIYRLQADDFEETKRMVLLK